MTKRPRSSGNGVKAVFLLGGVATSVLSTALITAQDKRAQAFADPTPTAEATQVQDVVVIDPSALPPVPTARPYSPPVRQIPASANGQQPAAQAPASGGQVAAPAPAAAAPAGIPTAIAPVIPAPQPAQVAPAAPAAPPAAPVASTRSSGG